jgi:hypothetical protein
VYTYFYSSDFGQVAGRSEGGTESVQWGASKLFTFNQVSFGLLKYRE